MHKQDEQDEVQCDNAVDGWQLNEVTGWETVQSYTLSIIQWKLKGLKSTVCVKGLAWKDFTQILF